MIIQVRSEPSQLRSGFLKDLLFYRDNLPSIIKQNEYICNLSFDFFRGDDEHSVNLLFMFSRFRLCDG